MRKKDLKFRYDVGLGGKPVTKNGVVNLVFPLPEDLREGDFKQIKTGVSFAEPVLLIQARSFSRYGVEMLNTGSLIFPGEEVILEIKARTNVRFERGETAAYAIPVSSNYNLVEG